MSEEETKTIDPTPPKLSPVKSAPIKASPRPNLRNASQNWNSERLLNAAGNTPPYVCFNTSKRLTASAKYRNTLSIYTVDSNVLCVRHVCPPFT
jgi:hypothetical protein